MIFCPTCLPKTAFVETPHGVKRINQLTPKDKVATLDSNGSRKWTSFYAYAHYDPGLEAQFMVLKLQGGKELILTADHLLFCYGPNGKRIAKEAGRLQPGDSLFYLKENSSLAEPVLVKDINLVTLKGVYGPLTMSGDFLANGVLVTCYGDISHYGLAQASFAPLRALYKLKHLRQPDPENIQGIHWYCNVLMKIRDNLPSMIKNKVS